MVTSASSYGRVVTETTLTLDRRTGDVRRNKTTATNHLVTRTQADPVQTEIIDRWNALGPDRQPGGRLHHRRPHPSPQPGHGEAMANVIADAQLAATVGAGNGGAQIALMNPAACGPT